MTCPLLEICLRIFSSAVGVVGACRRGGYAQAACPPRASQRQTGWCDYRGLARPTVLRQWRGAATGSGTGKTLLARHCQPRGCRCGHASLPRCPGRSPKGTSQTRCGRAPRPFATIPARPQRVPPTGPRRPRGSVSIPRCYSPARRRILLCVWKTITAPWPQSSPPPQPAAAPAPDAAARPSCPRPGLRPCPGSPARRRPQ